MTAETTTALPMASVETGPQGPIGDIAQQVFNEMFGADQRLSGISQAAGSLLAARVSEFYLEGPEGSLPPGAETHAKIFQGRIAQRSLGDIAAEFTDGNLWDTREALEVVMTAIVDRREEHEGDLLGEFIADIAGSIPVTPVEKPEETKQDAPSRPTDKATGPSRPEAKRPSGPKRPPRTSRPSSHAKPAIAEEPKIDRPFELGDPDWPDSAACRTEDPDLFFAPEGANLTEAIALYKKAKKICGRCIVRANCLDYALKHDERFGVWGGTTDAERKQLKRKLR